MTTAAARAVRKLDPQARDRLGSDLSALARGPRGPAVRKLTGVAAYRLRSGDHRVVFQIDDVERRILVLLVADRKTVYERLRRMKI